MGGYDSGVYGTAVYDAQELIDSLTIQDADVKNVGLVLADELAFVDVITTSFLFFKVVSDELIIAENLAKQTSLNKTDVLVLNEILNKNTNLSLNDIVSLVDADNKKTIKLIVDSLLFVEQVTRDMSRSLSDELVLTEKFSKGQFKEITDVLVLTDALNKKAGIVKTDIFTLIDSVNRGYFMSIDDTLNIADSVSYIYKTFVADMQKDFQNILADVPFAEDVTWTRPSKVEDEMGREASSSSWSKEISMLIQPISEKDRNVLGPGIEITSHMKAYVQWGFRRDDGFASVKTGDYIERKDGDLYIVEKVLGKHNAGGLEIFRKLILRAIDNDGV